MNSALRTGFAEARRSSRSGDAPQGNRAATGADVERARRRMVATVLIIYMLAIFEGSIRKFVLPQFGEYVFFVRDPLLLFVYWLATRYRLWPRHSVFLKLSAAMAFAGVALFVLQSATGGQSDFRLLLGVYGWRNYFLYIPLAFLIGAQFDAADLQRFARLTLWLAVPIAILVSLQFFSPKDAPINVGSAAEEQLQFKAFFLDGEHIRPSGPFTSNVGQQQFVTTALCFFLAGLISPASRTFMATVFLWAAGGGILTCVALGGSRGTLLQSVMIWGFALLIGVVGRSGKLKAKAVVLPLLLGLAAVLLYPILFPQGFAAFVERWNHADQVESAAFAGGVFGRALFGFVDFLRLVNEVPTLGYGLGFGGNASITLGATVDGVMPGWLAETDFARHMVDLGPLFGLGFIVFRLALVFWLLRLVLRATRRVPDPLPMMLFSYSGYVVLISQVTGHGSINVYGWLFTGLCIAACRVALQQAHGPVRRRKSQLRRPAPHGASPLPNPPPPLQRSSTT